MIHSDVTGHHRRIVIRPATTRTGRRGWVADLEVGGVPVFPLVPTVVESVCDDPVVLAYLHRHPDTSVEMAS